MKRYLLQTCKKRIKYQIIYLFLLYIKFTLFNCSLLRKFIWFMHISLYLGLSTIMYRTNTQCYLNRGTTKIVYYYGVRRQGRLTLIKIGQLCGLIIHLW